MNNKHDQLEYFLMRLKSELGNQYTFSIDAHGKINRTETSLKIQKKDNLSYFMFYDLVDLYRDIEKVGLDAAYCNLKQRILENDKPILDPSKITKKYIEDHVVHQMVFKQKNAQLLSEVPYKEFLDLAAILRVRDVLPDSTAIQFTMNNVYMKSLGLNEEELFEKAYSNMRNMGYQFNSMDTFIPGLFDGFDEEEKMYVLTNKTRQFAACLIMSDEALTSIYRKFNKPYYIIPSSTPELIILAYQEDLKVDDLKEMIKVVNQTVVPEEDFLSDSLYFYDGFKVKIV